MEFPHTTQFFGNLVTRGFGSYFLNQFGSYITFFHRPRFTFFFGVVTFGYYFTFVFFNSLAIWNVIYDLMFMIPKKII